MLNAKEMVERLGLTPLVGEGGMYVSTYNSERTLEGGPIGGAIYYLLHGEAFSHFHVLTGDEVWFWHCGDAVNLVTLWPDGTWKLTRLGTDLEKGEVPQFTVPRGVWMGACLDEGGDYALVSTATFPGYTDGSYTHADRAALMKQWPAAEPWITRLTGETFAF